MAEAPRSSELIFSCQGCSKEFTHDDDHIPRLLPCGHTLCQTCISQLIKGDRIECPECREKDEANKKEKSFPQNKYILTQIKKISTQEQPKAHELQKCEEHGMELRNLFCKEPGCGMPICRLCLTKYHKKHNIINIEAQEKGILMRYLTRTDTNLGTKVEILSQAKKNIGERTQSVIDKIKKKKEEFDRHCEMMIKEAEVQNKLQNMLIDDEISVMNSNIDLLRSLRQNIENEEEISHEEIMNSQETVRGIIENINVNLSGERYFEYRVITMVGSSAEEILGVVTQDKVTVSMPDLPKQIEEQLVPRIIKDATELKCTGISADEILGDVTQDKVTVCLPDLPKQIKGQLVPTDATELKCAVMKTINTGIGFISSITLISRNTAVISGDEAGIRKVKSYNLQTGAELSSLNLEDACGVAGVKMGENLALAVACRDEQKIEFRDVNDFNKILHSHSVAPHRPEILATTGASTLRYGDGSKKLIEVHWLDLSKSKPKPAAGKNVIHTRLYEMGGMCFVQDGDKQLLVVGALRSGLFAYNTKTDKLEWKVGGKVTGMEEIVHASGITTNGRGHLFVTDYNNECIQMFSASDGQYLRALMKGVETIGVPARVYWSAEASSLLVAAYSLQRQWYLNLINIQY